MLSCSKERSHLIQAICHHFPPVFLMDGADVAIFSGSSAPFLPCLQYLCSSGLFLCSVFLSLGTSISAYRTCLWLPQTATPGEGSQSCSHCPLSCSAQNLHSVTEFKTKSTVMPLTTSSLLHRKNLRLETEITEKTAGIPSQKRLSGHQTMGDETPLHPAPS